jgi:cytoplasmic iron level regulating protein YaaA (DUF328/UPF0246 family)
MLAIISPAKTQDFSDQKFTDTYSDPAFLKESEKLIKELKKKSATSISQLMEVSSNIAELNYERYQKFETPFTPDNSKQALLAFNGDVYTDIDIENFTKKEFEFAQDHLRILSGLYGILKPLDLIQPYRLEMKIKLKNSRGKNLYEFWGNRITKAINSDLEKSKKPCLVNLASQEYFKAIDTKKINSEIITPTFKENKNGEYKIIAIYAKRARGMMANFIIKNKLKNAEKLKTFVEGGYEYSERLSTEKEWVFIR